MAPLTALSIVTEPTSERAQKGPEVFRAWEKAGVRVLWVRNWEKALALSVSKLKGDPGPGLLVTGSLYLVGDCRKRLIGVNKLEEI
jgi:folylpolyglutamate synthase/dihydropteroate synthase